MKTLLALAQEASPLRPGAATPASNRHDLQPLKTAYRYCEALTASHSRSFYMATALLPSDQRRAVRALYAFCRLADNIVDENNPNPEAKLQRLRETMLSDAPPPGDYVAQAWADTRQRYHIPRRYAEQLIEGVERDLHQKRYATFDELAVYCYSVASTVGLMSMHIVGFDTPAAVPYAVKLGVALQLTNILRDVGEDWRAGRLYLPLDELAAHGLSEADVATGRVDDRWRSFVRAQIARTRRLYAESWPGIAHLSPSGRFAVGTASRLYEGILDDIQRHDYDVFHRRAHVPDGQKLLSLFKIYWQTRHLAKPTSPPTS